MFVQYEIWGVLDGRDVLVECVPTLKEAESLAESEREFHDEVFILEDKDGLEPVEVKRLSGL